MIREILTKWHDLIQSFLGFLRHGSASLVKSTMPISCPQTFPAIGRKIFWFLMELPLNPKSRTLGLSFLAPIALCWPKYFSSGSWQNLSVKKYLTWCCRRNLTASMIEWTVIFRPSNVCQEINILLQSFLEKLPGRCSIDVNQSSKYFKKTFSSQINRSSLTEVKGERNGFLSNSCDSRA